MPAKPTGPLAAASWAVAAATALVLVVLWFVFVHAPAPSEVCEHKMALIRAETEGGAQQAAARLLEKLERVCVENAQRRIRLRNKINYAKYARCVMSATSLALAEGC